MAGKGPAPSGFTISIGIEDVLTCGTSTEVGPAHPYRMAAATAAQWRSMSYPLSSASCLNITKAST